MDWGGQFRGSRSWRISATVFAITDEELAAADAYEVDDYARTQVVLRSGAKAWVYLGA